MTFLASSLAGCSCGGGDGAPFDAGLADVVEIDAPMLDAMLQPDANEAGVDAGVDAAIDAGADTGVDAGVDASADATLDAPMDAADPCATCLPTADCETAQCVNGACVRDVADDLSACATDNDAGDSMWCVSGACVAATCGDGIVAPDEACDDHNDVDGDACSNQCLWQSHTVYAGGPYGADLVGGSAVAVDGQGTLVTVWYEHDTSDGPIEVRARRMLPSGEVVDATWLAFNSSYTAAPAPVVVGLSGGGFAIALVMSGELYVRTVSATGVLGMLRKVADTLTVTGSTIAAVGTGFVVAWSKGGNLYAQRYSATGVTSGSRITVNTSVGSMLYNSHGPATIASQGDDWIIVWVRNQMPGNPVERSVYGRRFSGGTALDASEQLYSVYDKTALTPVVIPRVNGWLVAYAQGTDDPSGEIYTRAVSDTGVLSDPVLESNADSGTAVNESLPVLCAYGDDDYLLAWHLRVNQLNAHAIVGSEKLGVTPVAELAQLNTGIEQSGWIDGLSCATGPAGVWATWTSDGDVHAQLVPYAVAP